MKRAFTLLCATLTFFVYQVGKAQTTSGTVGTSVTTPNAPPAETYNLRLSQKLEMSGLIQTRLQLFQDSTKSDAFDLRRVRLIFRGDVAPKFGYRLQLEMANTPKILDAVFSYKPFEYLNVNVGQSKTPYCYDNYYSPFTLLAVSRTQIDNALSNRENDLYGNNQGRDIGIWLTGKYSIGKDEKRRPIIDYTLGVYNGSGMNIADNNSDKDFGGYLRVSPVKDLWLGGAFYNGTDAILLANPDSTADRKRVEAMLSYKIKRFLIEGEYLAGKDNELERNGYYATLSYVVIPDKFQVLVRLDNYDKDANKDLNAVNKYILAGSWYFSKTTRIQLQYDIVSEEDSDNQIDNNLFAIQFQAGF